MQDWTRARSVAETIKAEVYLYLAGIGEYGDRGRDQKLDGRVTAVEEDADDLLRSRAGIQPRERSLPR